ncbi:MAG: hybrid sensor histidine kinase/response regulator [Alphaproteobacteria bacterium]|nr:hybrid sensor histidine kinase/response regulator [Alphaproteobacteria bacterium]
MLSGWAIIGTTLLYLLLLFAVASYGDRQAATKRSKRRGRPLIYALSLAVYCTSWTYFGGVGLAAERGFEFLAIYIGPIIMFTIGMPIIRRIVNLAKAERLTSIADFVGARYGKNPTIAGVVALIAVIGTIPYIALQLKAVSSSVAIMVPDAALEGLGPLFPSDISLLLALLLAGFAIMFGTRHADATEHQDGLILAVAAESVVKLVAFTAVGLFVTFILFSGPGDLIEQAGQSDRVLAALTYETAPARWIVLTMMSAFAIVILPRQFHVTVVENRTERELRTARYLFPLYLVAINLFVIPIAIAGLLVFGDTGSGDQFVLQLPLANDMSWLSVATFIGGFSAATAMVIVASVAVAIMISNDLVMPILLRRNVIRRDADWSDSTGTILNIRRTSIFIVLLLGYAYYRAASVNAGLASIGLLSFASIAQIAPALFGGLIWKRANARGAVAGLCGGMLVWAYFLFLPSLGGPENTAIASATLSFLVPFTDIFSGPQADPLVNGVVLSLIVNTSLYVLGSLSRPSRSLERIQAGVFILQRSKTLPVQDDWQTSITVEQLQQATTKYLGAQRAERSFRTFETTRGRALEPGAPADMELVRYSEQLLGSAIGSASARLVLSLLFQKDDDRSSDTARLLDEASEALHYNRDLLQSALAQMNQGITVFDRSNRLSVWNRRFRSLLDLPESIGQVGVPLEDVITILAERGDIERGQVRKTIDNFLTMDASWTLTLAQSQRIIEIRSNPMPDNAVVTTYADITDRVASAKALSRVNETLEQRVAARTAELVRVNEELAQARAIAEDANLGKTRFLAAAGHDILQPLNAARLYSSSLVERLGESENRGLVNNIDSSLESVESILGAVLDISRLDTGAMKPQVSSFPLNEVLRRIETDFLPVAANSKVDLKVLSTSVVVRSDPNLLRRLIQNLVSNAIKYSHHGRVLVGIRHRGDKVSVQVVDTGIGIPSGSLKTVFNEFTRLDEGTRAAAGLGLGLSIVDRISHVLDHPVHLASIAGKGSDFRVEIPVETNISRVLESKTGSPPVRVSSNLDGLSVLCIDNELKILDGLNLLMTGWDCRVESVESVRALEAVLTEQDEPPHAIIADYHLDDGDGIQAVGLVRKRWGFDVPAILATADRSPGVRSRAEAQSISIFHKPMKPAALRAFLNQIAAARRSAAE